MTRHILALDQGTTSSRAILFRDDGGIVAIGQHEFPPIFPRPGWVEHDPEAIWRAQLRAARDVIDRSGITASQLDAIGITNQRETVVVWDRRTLAPVANAIVWQDRRTAAICEELRSRGLEDFIYERTGLVIDAYFSGTKLAWLLDTVPDARARAERGELAAGTIDSWLIARLTNGAAHVTDPTNASRTMLYNINRRGWDEDLLDILRVPAAVLPAVCPSSGDFGVTAAEYLGVAIPIAGVAGDQQAAMVGQACFEPGATKNTYGTGSFLLLVTGDRPSGDTAGMLTTLLAAGGGPGPGFALEGSIFVAGAAVQWLRDGLGLIRSSAEAETVASSVPSSDGVYVVPAFTGLGAPHWDMYARGAIFGLTRGSSSAHIVRATLESIAFQAVDVIRSMEQASGVPIDELRVDGGAAANDLLMQLQADYLGRPVVRPQVIETTAAGAAYLAGLAAGVWRDLSEIAGHWRSDRRFEPSISDAERGAALAGWHRAVERTRGWLDE
ncbi:MAG: glycerol kinase GlpK [Dehalococcoidia bacterium]